MASPYSDVIEPSPIIIIGAARSGTNALRDMLTSTPAFSTWPCDEINYIWRSGNRDAPTDEFERVDARPELRAYIRKRIRAQARRSPGTVLVEKTCANSLRVGFVNEILPEALIVYIERDGRDVVSSAMARFHASLDLAYVLRKARFVPKRDLPYYATKYLRTRVSRSRSASKQLPTWGPRFAGLDQLVQDRVPLDEICARQWAASVASSRQQLSEIEDSRVLTVSYANFTTDPETTLSRVAHHAGVSISADQLLRSSALIHQGSVGAWKQRLDQDALRRIAPIIAELQPETGP